MKNFLLSCLVAATFISIGHTQNGSTISDTICYGEAYILPDGNSYTEPGTYILNNGNTEPDTLVLGIYPITPDIYLEEYICESDLPPPGPIPTPQFGNYHEVLTDENGCNYNQFTNTYVIENPNVYTVVELCEGETYEWNDEVYSESGEYLFQAYTIDNCQYVDVLELIVLPATDCLTNIEDRTELAIELFPNPASEIITISGLSDQLEFLLIHDMHGQLINKVKVNNNQNKIVISNLKAGIYILSPNKKSIGNTQIKFIKT